MSSRPPYRRPQPAQGRTAETASLFGGPADRALTVSAFVARVNGVFRAALPDTWVRGEVGDWKVWSSGHAYFTLKDPQASLPAMMWADDVARLRFSVEPGLVVLARGRPDVYPRSGKLSFVVAELEPAGAGALQIAFEQLKARLAAEGLFDLSRKRPLPALPRRIGVVTSRHGAAVRDVLKVLRVRFPNAHVTIYPVAVQGEGAAVEIARGIRAFSRTGGADVLIVARGGGSKEDLAAFNDERVVRAVAASSIPTVSAVGHEVDVTLTDLAADVRAATPSQAAELVVARREELEGRLTISERRLLFQMRSQVASSRATLMALAGSAGLGSFPSRVSRGRLEAEAARRALVASVRDLPAVYATRLAAADDGLRGWPSRAAFPHVLEGLVRDERALAIRMRAALRAAGERLGSLAAQLSAIDPLRVLSRGYSVTYREGSSRPLRRAGDVAVGDAIRVLLSEGEVSAEVREVRAGSPGRRTGGTGS